MPSLRHKEAMLSSLQLLGGIPGFTTSPQPGQNATGESRRLGFMLAHRRCAMNRPRLSSERVEHLPTALLRSRVTLAPTDSCPAGAVRVTGPSSTRISMADVDAVGVAAETAMESAKADWVAEMVEEWMPNKARLRTFFNGCGTRLHKNHVSVQRTYSMKLLR